MAWMAAGLVEKMVTWVEGWVFKYSWAWRMAEARAARSASKAVAVTPMCRVALATSWPFAQRDAAPIAGWRSSSRCQLDLEPRAKTVRWLVREGLDLIVLIHSFFSSPWRTLWLLERRGEEKSSCQGGAARRSMRGPFGRLAARERWLEIYERRGGRTGRGSKPARGGPQGPGTLASSCELRGRR